MEIDPLKEGCSSVPEEDHLGGSRQRGGNDSKNILLRRQGGGV